MPCAGANGLLGTRCMSDEPIAKVVVPSEALMAGPGRLTRAVNVYATQKSAGEGGRMHERIAAAGKTAVYTVPGTQGPQHD